MPVDADLAAAQQRFAALDAQTPDLDYVQRRRLLSELQARLLRSQPLAGVAQQTHLIAAAGREIPVRSYTPSQSASGRTLVWLHGGGWMVGSLDTHDDLCEHLAQYTGHQVLSLHYRRSPENPFPAALDDLQELLAWLERMAGVLPFAGQPLLLGGDSAGAHLALAWATGAALNPELTQAQGLLLLYPPLLPNQDYPSMQAFGQGFGLSQAAMSYYWEALGGEGHRLRTPSQVCEALPSLPPMVLVSASHDILRDEAEAFAATLQALPKGPRLAHFRADGMLHGFARMLTASPRARLHVQRACELLDGLLSAEVG